MRGSPSHGAAGGLSAPRPQDRSGHDQAEPGLAWIQLESRLGISGSGRLNDGRPSCGAWDNVDPKVHVLPLVDLGIVDEMGAPSPDRCLHRHRLIVMSHQPNEPGFDIRGALFGVLGQV
jgi:hypothetical protein